MPTKSKARENKALVSETLASQRAKRITNVSYQLWFDLDEKGDDFKGRAGLSFHDKDPGKELTIDFTDGKIQSIAVNGKKADVPYSGNFITLPAKTLKRGSNSIVIEYTHPYSKSGSGLYRFKDPEDGLVYLYTHFEPYDANSVFPCFDQPDIKATYKLTVHAPESWTVVSSTLETSVSGAGEGKQTWTFPETAKFSTYLVSMHAGPYDVWEDSDFHIPMRLFARKTYAKYVNAEEWFKWSRQGFDFFEEYFDTPYPFVKYDQLLVPDFNMGAMENVAAVTFREGLVQRGQSTRREKERLCNVILHEMAHMWFGNLVTMQWWDDLWLNESFATYMATMACVEATEFKESWLTFFLDDKYWGMLEDSWPTTHPIQADVPDTEQAFTNFDGITYGKGASVLKQLNFYLSPESFKKGVQDYFHKHAYGNTRLPDFMGALEKATNATRSKKDKVDLKKSWTEKWLMKAGTNLLAPQFAKTKDGKLKSVKLVQTSISGAQIARPHRTEIGLYDVVGGELRLRKSVPVRIEGKIATVPELDGETIPDVLYVNTHDHAFAKAKLDPASLKNVAGLLSKIQDDHLRAMIWESLWDMVREGEFKVMDYCELVLENLAKETDAAIAQRVGMRVVGARGRRMIAAALYYIPKGAARDGLVARLEKEFHSLLMKSKPGSDLQKLWLEFFMRTAESSAMLTELERFVTSDKAVPGYQIDQDRRWEIVVRLSEMGYPKAGALIAAEKKRDPSDFGKKSALAAEAISPDPKVKKAIFEELTRTDRSQVLPKTFAEQRAVMGALFPISQQKLREPYSGTYYETLKKLVPIEKPEFLQEFAAQLAPAFCEEKFSKGLEQFLLKAGKGTSLPAYVKKPLKIALDENKRCKKVRASVGVR